MIFKPSRLGPSQPLRTNWHGPSKCAEHGAHQHGFGSTVSVLLPWIRGSISDKSPSAVHRFVHSSHRFPEETLCFPASARASVGSIYPLPPRVLRELTDPSGRTPSQAVELRSNHGRAPQEHFHSQNFCCRFYGPVRWDLRWRRLLLDWFWKRMKRGWTSAWWDLYC